MASASDPSSPAPREPGPAPAAGHGQLLDELNSFLYELRDAGYGVGLHQFLALQKLLLAQAAAGGLRDVSRLRSLIGPLVAKNPSQQSDFAARFDRWAAGRRPEIVSETPADEQAGAAREVHQLTTRLRRWRRLLAAAAVLIVAISVWALLRPSKHDRGRADSDPAHRGLDQHRPMTKPQMEGGPAGVPVTRPTIVASGARPTTVASAAAPSTLPAGASHPAAMAVPDKVPSPWHAAAVVGWAAGALLFLGAAYALWWEAQARRFLRKRAANGAPPSASLVVDDPDVGLFRGPAMTAASLRLGLRRRRETGVLDIEATVDQYACTGTFTPVGLMTRQSPEYLFLIDRATAGDQQARLIDQFVSYLRGRGLFVERYWFQGDPRVCVGEQGRGRLHRLADLAAAYAGHRLVLCGDGGGLIDPLSAKPFAWVDQFTAWPDRALLTPDPPAQWGGREIALAAAGFITLPATDGGLLALAHHFNGSGEHASLEVEQSFPLPDVLVDNPRAWLAHHPPPDADVDHVLTALRAVLGDGGYYWLSACAAYPELQWGLTLYFGTRLRDDEGHPLLNEATLLQLVRLPWFREGLMPDWLRGRLIRELPREREQAVRGALESLLLSAVDKPARGAVLEIAEDDRPTLSALTKRVVRLLQRQSQPDAPVRERVFASFMADDLRVRIPRVVVPLVRSMRRTSFRAVAGAAAVLTLLIVLTAVWLGREHARGPVRQASVVPTLNPPDLPSVFTNSIGMKLVRITPGTFMMGSPAGEEGRIIDETQHQVTLTKPYYMGAFHVTRGQFAAFVAETGYQTDAEKKGDANTWRNPGFAQEDSHPVVEVSWNDAVAYTGWLSRKEHKTYRLPTEAEWEYACRAGTTTPFNTGATISTDQANYNGNSTYGAGVKGVYRQKTTAAGSFPANKWGLYDMHGNAWQWCSDVYGDYPAGPVTDPTGPVQDPNASRLRRGGSWFLNAVICRSARRSRNAPGDRGSIIGFRVVLDSP